MTDDLKPTADEKTLAPGDGAGGRQEEFDQQLSLAGLCTKDNWSAQHSCQNKGSDGIIQTDDNYIFFGDPDLSGQNNDSSDSSPPESGEDVPGRTSVTLKKGDTFWKLCQEKYGDKYPIEAIYEANGLTPKVTEAGGKVTLEDPTYYAGKTYVLPAQSEIEELTKQYRQKVKELGQTSEQRVGTADERTDVTLIYGDTFWSLSDKKYGGTHPIEAIYEANGLTPGLKEEDGQLSLEDPTYYAGTSYVLPAQSEIPELTRSFWQRMGHPEMCPEEYSAGQES